MEPLIRAEQISYHVPGKRLLHQVSFSVMPGELLVILGSNGAGKSTLTRVLSGELKPSGGSVLFHGKELTRYPSAEISRKRAVLTQQNNVNLNFRTDELVMMGRYPHFEHQPSLHDNNVIAQVMLATGISHLSGREYRHLSGGEQQRVQLARILAQVWDMPGALLLLDEPVTGLDMLYQQQVMSIAKSLTARGFTVIAVLHDLNLAVSYADRLIMLAEGEKYCEGTAAEVITAENIYGVFGIEADVFELPGSLHPFIVPKMTPHPVLS